MGAAMDLLACGVPTPLAMTNEGGEVTVVSFNELIVRGRGPAALRMTPRDPVSAAPLTSVRPAHARHRRPHPYTHRDVDYAARQCVARTATSSAPKHMAAEFTLINDDQYVRRVRRYRPSSLVPLIASVGARYWENQSWLKSPYKKFTLWALVDIARVSLVMGTEFRDSQRFERDLLRSANDYVNLADPEFGQQQPDALDGFLLRR
jgi:hypothetical protein